MNILVTRVFVSVDARVPNVLTLIYPAILIGEKLVSRHKTPR